MIFFNSNEITIYRQRRKTGSNRFVFSATLTAAQADIQPASQERLEMIGGRFGATYVAFVEQSVNIKEGDRISSEGKVYMVKGVSNWESVGLLQHKELILVSQDAND